MQLKVKNNILLRAGATSFVADGSVMIISYKEGFRLRRISAPALPT